MLPNIVHIMAYIENSIYMVNYASMRRLFRPEVTGLGVQPPLVLSGHPKN